WGKNSKGQDFAKAWVTQIYSEYQKDLEATVFPYLTIGKEREGTNWRNVRANYQKRAYRRSPRGGRRRDPRRRRQRHAADPRPEDARQDRCAGAHHLPALEQARYPRRQRRHPGPALAARPRDGGCLE